MPDIRSFFGPKGGGTPSVPKPAPKKTEDEPSKRRGKARKVVQEDSDDEDIPIESKKPTTRSTPKKKAAEKEVEGTTTTASEYFASSKSKPKSVATAEPKLQTATKLEVRTSPRAAKKTATATKTDLIPAKNGAAPAKKRSTTAFKKHTLDDNDDDGAFIDDDDDDGDDIFAADAKGRSKRKNDDYAEEESEEEFLPKPKRIASRSKPTAFTNDEDDEPVITKATKNSKAAVSNKKRKSPESESDEDDEVSLARKKPVPKKPRAPPKAKKADEPEDAAIQAILDDIPTVRPPTPPAKDPNAKFDWKKAQAGGGNAGPPPNPQSDLPEGEEDCLAGLTFVFTGQLTTIAREDAQALVKRYGGKVTGQPSSKTSYVVLGEDAGPSKLAKIQSHNIKTIDERGLFELIRRLPAGGGGSKGAEKVRQKRQEEEEKIKKQAEEMEREEKARKLEAEKARKLAAARGVTGPAPAAVAPSSQLWTVKYAPTQASHICGNKTAVEKIQNWLRNWSKSRKYDFQKRGADGMGGTRAIMLSGPPGIGKTTAAHLAAKLEGFDVLEQNASDSRSKKLVELGVSDVMNNTSLNGYFAGDGKKVDATKKKIALIMDEVDGMSAGDRGGVGALAKFCKKTDVPLILICNDRRLPKMSPFDAVVTDIKFQRPTVDQVRSRMMTICHREGLKLSPQVLNALIEGSNKDIRQTINMLATVKLDQTSMDFDQSKDMTKAWEKSVVLKPWDICQKMLGGGLFNPASKSTLNDKIELYFNDHEFSFLMIQENYLRTKPAVLTGNQYNKREQNLKALELADQAAESISDGDLVDRMIHGPQQHWSLMPTHAVFSTVKPASYVAGLFMGCVFTTWLGNNSKYGKLGRYIREIHSHMRLRSSGDHNEVRQQYLPVLWTQLVKRLEVEGKESVEDVIELMDSYFLTREDFDCIKELGVGPQDEQRVNIETQTKATFTRLYNAASHPVPFLKATNVMAPKKAAKEQPDLEEAIEEEDEGEAVEAVEGKDEDEIKGDKYIKQPKAKAKRAPKKAAKTAGDNDEDDEDEKPQKAKGKGKAGGSKGKAKK